MKVVRPAITSVLRLVPRSENLKKVPKISISPLPSMCTSNIAAGGFRFHERHQVSGHRHQVVAVQDGTLLLDLAPSPLAGLCGWSCEIEIWNAGPARAANGIT